MVFFVPLSVIAMLYIGLAGSLLALLFWTWREWDRQAVALARHTMFQERDRIFLMFAKSMRGASDPSHVKLRDAINSIIRFSHCITLPRIMLISRNLKPSSKRQSWHFENINDGRLRDDVVLSVNKIHQVTLWLPMSRSPLLYLLSKSLGWLTLQTGLSNVSSSLWERVGNAIYTSRPAGDLLDRAERRGLTHAA